jgi:hypothetical protein
MIVYFPSLHSPESIALIMIILPSGYIYLYVCVKSRTDKKLHQEKIEKKYMFEVTVIGIQEKKERPLTGIHADGNA